MSEVKVDPVPRWTLSEVRKWCRLQLVAICVIFLMVAFHLVSLLVSATQHSPTYLEPAFLASGISHWYFCKFDLYRVNPPLPRMVAAIPALVSGAECNWTHYFEGPGSRSEFPVGEDFAIANGQEIQKHIVYARWACIPFSVLSCVVMGCWAFQLYGPVAAMIAVGLYVFDPNLIGHAELVTPDCAAWGLGLLSCYTFWIWLKRPTWWNVVAAGVALGLAQLSKCTWVILFVILPVWTLIWEYCLRKPPAMAGVGGSELDVPDSASRPSRRLSQLVLLLVLSLYVLNMGYAFDGTFAPLGSYAFVSAPENGNRSPGLPGNRFKGTWAGEVPVPLPRQYVLGIDSQRKDFQKYEFPSFLRGEWRQGGWWYYYLYGLMIKTPCGTILLLALSIVGCVFGVKQWRVRIADEFSLVVVPLTILVAASMQTEFNHHLRYVFPILVFLWIWVAGNVATVMRRHRSIPFVVAGCCVWTLVSVGMSYPHQISYFNELVGGPEYGSRHLVGSSVDWGQDLCRVKEYVNQKILEGNDVTMVVVASFPPEVAGVNLSKLRVRPMDASKASDRYIVMSRVALSNPPDYFHLRCLHTGKDGLACLSNLKRLPVVDRIGWTHLVFLDRAVSDVSIGSSRLQAGRKRF